MQNARTSFLCLLTLSVASLSAVPGAAAQTAKPIRTVFVEPSDASASSHQVERQLVRRIEKSGTLRVAPDRSSADAVLKVSAVLWSAGTFAPNPRSTNTVAGDYQGYASADLDSRSNQPLWSYLVTPSRFHFDSPSADLAGQLYKNLALALKNNSVGRSEAASPSATTGATVRVAGATFPAPLYARWFESYAERDASQPIPYDAVGSVAGLRLLAEGKIDLAASDIPTPGGDGLLRVPVVIGGVVPIYNLPGSPSLRLTGEVLAAIYSGTIHTWDDPKIREYNRQARLPHAEIHVIHRAEGSGTTYVFTSFLATASPAWRALAGPMPAWPTGTGATGNAGVAAGVGSTPNSIGYVELTYAIQHHLSYAAVRNPAGVFVRADLSTLTSAAEADAAHSGIEPTLLNAPGPNSYPIASFTYLILRQAGGQSSGQAGASPALRASLADLLRWTLTSGQKQCASLGYAPLPKSLADAELKQVEALK